MISIIFLSNIEIFDKHTASGDGFTIKIFYYAVRIYTQTEANEIGIFFDRFLENILK